MLPIGGSGSQETSECQPSPLARGLSLSAWMIISSGCAGSAGAAGWMCNSPNLRPKSRCCSCDRCWSRKKITRFSARARWISSICRLLGVRRSTSPISAPMIGVSLSTVIDSKGESAGVYLIRGPLKLRSELCIRFLLGMSGAENPAENRIDVLQMIVRLEQPVDVSRRQKSGNLGVGLQPAGEASLALPRRHRMALHEAVGVLAAHPCLRQRQQHALRVDKSAERFQILAHT